MKKQTSSSYLCTAANKESIDRTMGLCKYWNLAKLVRECQETSDRLLMLVRKHSLQNDLSKTTAKPGHSTCNAALRTLPLNPQASFLRFSDKPGGMMKPCWADDAPRTLRTEQVHQAGPTWFHSSMRSIVRHGRIREPHRTASVRALT